MITVKSPYRISACGGSTDYESFYSQYGAFLIGFAIQQYSYVSINHTEKLTDVDYQAYYSVVEKVKNIQDIQNAGIRGPLQYLSSLYDLKNIAVYVQNELPSRTGIGSSSSLICGILNAIHTKNGFNVNKKQLAKEAIFVERVLLQEAGGIQDEIFAAYGGLISITIEKDGNFIVRPIPVSEDFIKEFQLSSILFYTNNQRDSFEIAKSHDNKNAINNKLEILNLAHEMYEYFTLENIPLIGTILNKSWYQKRKISSLISNPYIDSLYEIVIKNGAFGAKLLGSGGSGFLYTIFPKEKRQQLIDAVKLPHLDISIDNQGSHVIFKE